MAKYTSNRSKGDISDDVVGFTAGERDSDWLYQSSESLSRLLREFPKEISVPEFYDLKKYLEDSLILIKEDIKAIRDDISEERKALRDKIKDERKAFLERMEANNIQLSKVSMTEIKMEIKMSFERSELELQRLNEELLHTFNAKISKCTHLKSQVQKETEVELRINNDNKIIEENVELINKGAMEAVTEQQKLCTEVVNVVTVRSLDDRNVNQQLDVLRHHKLKKRTQGNGVSQKESITVLREVI
jgi:hypothetical protein